MVVYTAGQEQLTSLVGTTTVIDCPIQSIFTFPIWTGPPNGMIYTQNDRPGFNENLPNKDRVSYSSNNRSLRITQTAFTDAGTYRCTKTVDGNLLVGTIVLQVRKPPSTPVLSTNVGELIGNKLIVTEDQPVTLTCTSRGGYPAYTVNIYRNIASGTPVTGTSNTNTEDDGTITVTRAYVMTVRRTDDRVNLICRSGFSTEPFGYQNTTVKLFPNLKPTTTTVSSVGSPVSGDNSKTIARCVTSGFRPSSSINMTMSFSGITNTYTTAVEDTNTETYSITADYNRAVQTADNGQSLTCSVIHQTLSTPISQSVSIDVKFAPNSVSLTGNTSVVANGNNKLTLTCTAGSSNPASNITWTYNVNGITKQNQYKAGSYNGRVTSQQLELTPTRDDDGKTVRCSASNTVNTPVTSEAKTLLLQYHPIATMSGPTLVTEGDENVVLNCSAHSQPLSTFTWYHNNFNTPLSGGSAANNVGLYKIPTVSRTDYGTYKCRASNNISPASEPSMEMTVKFAPVSASVMGNTRIVADGINKIELTCTTGTSNPASSIVWKRQNINITSNRQLQMSPGNYGGQIATQILKLTPTRNMYGHNVTCEAGNGINGQSAAIGHIKLDIRYNPELTTRSQPPDLKEGVSSVTLTCSVSSKPDSTIKWYKDGNTNPLKPVSSASNNNVLVHTIHQVQRSHAGNYTCSANNNIGGDVTSKVQVVVQYAPDVTVTTQNVTINDSHVDILCSPSGVPASYTYQPWTQAWVSDGSTVSLKTQLGSSPTLRLTNLSYQHSGVYTCRASNGVTESIHKDAGQGDAHLKVESYPIITEPVVTTGQYHKVPTRLDATTNISVKYYNNGGTPSVNCYKLDNNTKRPSTVHAISSKPSIVQLPVFKQTINTTGITATVSITITQESQFGYYAVVIKNNRGERSVQLQLIPEGPPSVPEDLIVDAPYQNHVSISWIRGFHGGFDQTFVIQLSQDDVVWWNKTSVFGGQVTSRDRVNTTVDELLPETQYFIRMFSYNQEGKSPFTVAMNFTTIKNADEEEPPQTGLIIGAAAGGFILAAIVVVIGILLYKRYNGSGKPEHDVELNNRHINAGADNDSDDEVITENATYDSAGPRPQDNQRAGTSNEDNTYAIVNKPKKPLLTLNNKDVYAEVQKPKKKGNIVPEIYALPVKKKEDKAHEKSKPKEKEKKKTKDDKAQGKSKLKEKEKKKAKGNGDVYENAPAVAISGAYDENPYENPEDSIPNRPKKNVNKDGLVYADLSFKPDPKGQGKLVIHGLDDMTEYVQVDFTKKAEPLPDSDEEDQNANTKK